jgi:membrane protease YdiL (CAAX protease family)
MASPRYTPSSLRVLTLALLAWAAYAAARSLVQALLPSADLPSYLEQDAAVTVLRLGCLAFCLWLGRLRYTRESFWNLPGRKGLAWGLGAWMAAAFALSCFARAYAPFNAWNAGSRALELAIALVAAANEEIGWRATLFEPLREALGQAWSLGLSTLGFSLMHLGTQPWQAWPRIVFTGLALGLARLRGVSLGALIAIHFACDACLALYQPEGAVGSWTLDSISAGLVAAAAIALYFAKPKAPRP